ncbi:hypothetical protein PENSPDRAFT_684403 [Peniophora sp. CONT]|nr:hypothetical protein PENSPDRAFT_684403 [Peniophora sp. CONT]
MFGRVSRGRARSLFARQTITTTTTICTGYDDEEDKSRMRKEEDAASALLSMSMNVSPPPQPTPGPSTIPAKRAASEAALDVEHDGGEGITCICEYVHDDGFSISCDSCSLWYHGACVDVSSSNCPNEWLCPSCTGRPVNVARAKELQRQIQKNMRKRPPSPVRSRARASILNANGNGGKRGRRTSKSGGEEAVNVQELYVAIDTDDVQDGDARERLRQQAHSWRGLSALDPFLVDKEPPPANTAVGQLPGWPTEFAIKAQSNIPRERFIQPFRSTITPSSAYLADPLNAYAQHGMPRPFVHLIGPPLNLALDARVNGNNARFIRSGCHPNAVLRPIICPAAKKKAGQEEEPDITFGVFSLKDVKAGEEVVLGWEWDDGNTIHHLPALLKSPELFPPERQQQIKSQLRVMLHSLGRTFTSCACGSSAPDCALSLADAFVNGTLPVPPPHKADLGPLVGSRRNFAARENGRMGAAEPAEMPREDVLPPKMRRRSVPNTTPVENNEPSGAEPTRPLADITSAHVNAIPDEDLMPPPPAPPKRTNRRVSPNQPASSSNAKPTSSRKRMKTGMTMPSPEPYSPSTPFSHLSLVSPVTAPAGMGWPTIDELQAEEEQPSMSASTSGGRAKKGKGRARKPKVGEDAEEESVLPASPITRRASFRGKKRKRASTPEPEPEVEVGEADGMDVDTSVPVPVPEIKVDVEVEETPASPPPDVLAGDEAPAEPAPAPTDPTPPPASSPPEEQPKDKPKRRVRIPQALRRVPASPEGSPEPSRDTSGSARDESEQPSSALTSPPNERVEMSRESTAPPKEEDVGRSRSSSVPPLPTPPEARALSPVMREPTPPVRESTPAPRETETLEEATGEAMTVTREPTPPPHLPTPPPRDPTPPPPPKVKLSLKDFKLRKMREREEQEQARAAAPPEPEAEADVEMAPTLLVPDVEMDEAGPKTPAVDTKENGMSVDVKAEVLDDLAQREEDTTMETDTTAVDETPSTPASAVPVKPAFYVPPPPLWSRPSSPVNPPPPKIEVAAGEPEEETKVDDKPAEEPKPHDEPKAGSNPDGLDNFTFSFRPPDISPPSAPAAFRALASSPGASVRTHMIALGNGGSPPARSRSPTLTPHSPAASFSRSVTSPKDISPLYGNSKASSPAWSKPTSPIQSKPMAPAWMRNHAASPSPAPTASLLARISSPPPSSRDYNDYSRSVSPAMSSRGDAYSPQPDSAPSYTTKDTYTARSRGRPALQAVQTNNHRATPSKDPPPHKDLPPHMSNANFTPLPNERRFGVGLGLGRMTPSTPTQSQSQSQQDDIEDGEVPSDPPIPVPVSVSVSLPSTPIHHEPLLPRAPPTQPRAFQALRAGAPPPSGPRALRLQGLGGLPRQPQAERVSDRGWGRTPRGPGAWGGRG